MKRLVFLLSFILSVLYCFAQQGEIVFTDYGSDSTVVGFDNFYFYFDIDFDGEDDFYIQNYMGAPDDHLEFIRFRAMNDSTSLAYPIGQEPGLGHDTIQEGDSLVLCNEWRIGFEFRWACNICPEPSESFWDGFTGYVGTRKKVEDSYYYGWIEFKSYWWYRYNGIWVPTVILYKSAFCTIPDYPLKVGQTSLNWNVEENGAMAFASIYPNPTEGKIIVRGNDLALVEVYNTLGQRVTSVKGGGETLQIDIAHQPAGLYFVNVTDTEGRKCVKKVVKR